MRYPIRLVQLLVSILIVGWISVSFAHRQEFHENGSLPSCETIANDPDGDGYGWVPHITGAHSCIVDQNTKPKPLFASVAGETRPLNMIRTYWDPNVDFANKEIECTIFRDENAFYDHELSYLADVFTIIHYPLPDVKPYKGEYEITFTIYDSEQKATNTWRAADGRYFAEMHYYNPIRTNSVGLFAGDWGEPIDIDGQQGMRFWYGKQLDDPEVIQGSMYQDCKYTSGEPFRPTGSFDQTATPSGVTEFDITSLSAGPAKDQKPEIIHPLTNAMIDLQSFSWNIRDDLLFREILCLDRQWNGNYFDTYDSSRLNSYTFMPPLAGETSGRLYFKSRYGAAYEMTSTYFWSVNDGEIHTTTRSNRAQPIGFPVNGGWYEAIVAGASSTVHPEDSKDGVRVWHDDISFDTCWLEVEYSRSGEVLRPTGPTDTTNNDPDNTQDDSPATDDNNNDQSTSDSEQIDNSDNDSSDQNSLNSGQADNNPTTDSDMTTGSQNQTEPTSGTGSFSMLILWLLVLSNRLYRRATLTRTSD